MNKIPQYYYLDENGLKTIWVYITHGKKSIWLSRLGDAVTKSFEKESFLTLFKVIRSNRLIRQLNEIFEDEKEKVQGHIYDLYVEDESEGKWFVLYKTKIHNKGLCREIMNLK